MDELAFEEVLAAARTGAGSAVTALFREFQPALLSYLRFRHPNDAEDLAQEVWVGVGRGLARFQGDEAAFRAWLFTIARRRVADLRRTQSRHPADPTRGEHFATLEAGDDPEDSALASVQADDTLAWIAASLPRDQAEVVILRLVGGLDAAQVGAVLGKRPGAVRALQHRALKRLAAVFSPEGITP